MMGQLVLQLMMYLQQALHRIHLHPLYAGFGVVVAVRNLPGPEVSFFYTAKGLRMESFCSSAISKITPVADSQ